MKRIALLALACLVACTTSFAASSPDAAEWLDKMAESAGGSFKTEYRAEMNQNHMGMELSLTLDGELLQADPKHMRSTLTMTLKNQAMPDGMRMTVLTVADGSHAWTEMEMMGGKQVMKVSLDALHELAAGDPRLAQMKSSDPLSQIRHMSETFDFSVTDRADGRVTLSAKMTEDGLAALGQAAPSGSAKALSEMTLVLDEKTGFPASIAVGGDDPMITMYFDGFETVDAASFPAEAFSYTPPAGANVMDLGAMVGGQNGAK